MIRSLNPDVLTLDIEMPNMNGLSFLKRLMRVRPMPVVMLSSHTQEGSDIAFRALAMGAVDFVGDNRIIFDIGGNKFRLIVHVAYAYGRVLVEFVGTHKEYDAINVETV